MTGERSSPARRARPSQARAVATVERILDGALVVLVERGLQGFNTNAVAEAARVNVGTLYHYFADKNAILHELYQRDQEIRSQLFAELVSGLGTTTDLAGHIHRIVDAAAVQRTSSPGSTTLRRACRAVPEMMDYDREVTARFVASLRDELQIRLPGLDPARLTAAAMSLVDLTRSVLDLIGEEPVHATAIQRELELTLVSYLCELDRAAAGR